MRRTICRWSYACVVLMLTALGGCSGGMSDAQVSQSLVAFFGEIDQAYADAGAPPLGEPGDAMVKWTIALESAQLAIVESYLAANAYPAQVLQHMTDMRNGLSARLKTYQSWADAGLNDGTAPADEVSAVNDAAMKSTSAETQLRIAAGL